VFKVQLTGDWSKAKGILGDSTSLKAAINYAVMQEAQQVRRQIVKGITSQAPGGKQFAPLAATTLALRKAKGFKGSKALLVTGGLRNSVTVKQTATGRVFVGVLRNARGKDGKSLVNIAQVHEFGATIVIKVTPRMRRMLMANLAKSKLGKTKESGGRGPGGRFKKWKFKASGGGQLSKGILVIKIPARPFIGPVIDQVLSDPKALQRRLAVRIAKKLRLALGSA